MTRSPRWLRLATLSLCLLVLLVAPLPARTLAQGQGQGQPADGWVSLGPDVPLDLYALAVSSAWPDDPFIIARTRAPVSTEKNRYRALEPAALRTFDGGKTWEPLPDAPPLDLLTVAQTRQPQRMIFGLSQPRNSSANSRNSTRQILRSTDDGTTWSDVLAVLVGDRPQLILSPSFADDGQAYLLNGTQLFETRDAGASWTLRQLVSDQYVHTLAFSPGFSTDRTLFASVVTSAPGLTGLPDADVESAGILVSRDAGLTWSSMSDGLRIDGSPYRQVQALAISPAFATDHTLFAFAWGPLERFADGSAKWKQTALFKSGDGGASWNPMWQPNYRPQPLPGSYIPSFSLSILPSRMYANDARIVIGVRSGTVSPTSGGCQMLLSQDRGATWSRLAQPESIHNCTGAVLLPGEPPTVVYSGSLNYGMTSLGVFAVTLEARAYVFQTDVVLPGPDAGGPVLGRDGSVFFGTKNGVRMLPPAGRIPMSTP